MSLQQTFEEICQNYCKDIDAIQKHWEIIYKAYSGPKRHYHNLDHLNHLMQQLDEHPQQINHHHALGLAVFYHDIVYNVLKKDNEEKSAVQANESLKELQIPEPIRHKVTTFILATKTHETHPEPEINLFTDADLSILGEPWDKYEIYCHQIRKEYSIYPALIYKPGRKKVVTHLLEMPYIFKTEAFRTQLEERARANLLRELQAL